METFNSGDQFNSIRFSVGETLLTKERRYSLCLIIPLRLQNKYGHSLTVTKTSYVSMRYCSFFVYRKTAQITQHRLANCRRAWKKMAVIELNAPPNTELLSVLFDISW
jgi:hypothetical protein